MRVAVGVQDDKAQATILQAGASSFVAIHLKKGSLLLSKLPHLLSPAL